MIREGKKGNLGKSLTKKNTPLVCDEQFTFPLTQQDEKLPIRPPNTIKDQMSPAHALPQS